MIQFEIEIMVICIRPESDLFDNDFGLFRLEFFVLLLLFVEELPVVDDLTDRWVGLSRYLHQVQAFVLGQGQCIPNGHHLWFHVVSDHSHALRGDLVIDPVRVFTFYV